MSERLKKFGPYLIFLAAMLWASDAPFRVYLTENLSSNFIVFVEHLISFVILLPLLFVSFKEFKGLNWKYWLAILFIGVGGSALALVAFTQSFSYMNPSVVILLQKLQPLIAIALAVALLKETLGKRFWLWTIIALGGAYLISFPDFVPRLFEGEVFNPHIIGVSLALLAAVLWAASTVLGRYVLDKISFKAMTSVRFLVATLFLLIWNASSGALSTFSQLAGKDWLFLAIISVTSGAVAMFIYYKGLSHSKASIATIAELGFPVAAVAVNYIFLDASLSLVQGIGIAVLLYAIFQLGKVNAQGV
ncbi:MAG: DMT family transporter [bacterium]|nr:DMT family transporter [bacterium]